MSERRLPDKPGLWWYLDRNGEKSVAEVKNCPVEKCGYCCQCYFFGNEYESDSNSDFVVEWIGPVNPEPLPWPKPSIDPTTNLPTKAGYYYYEGVDGSRRISFVSNDNPEQLMALSEGFSDTMIPVNSPVFARWIGRIEQY